MKIQLKKYNLFSIGQQSFLLGTFFLASALPISGIFFLISICISFKENKSKIFKDNWNYPLFLATGLIIFGALNNTNFNHQNVIHEIEKSNISQVTKLLGEDKIYFENIGKTQNKYFEVEDEFNININDLFKINNTWYNSY